MAEFDPYWKWLGIPPAEQPPNLYRSSGIGLFESDAEVIAGAADRQSFDVRDFQSGADADIAQFILNELSTALAARSIRRASAVRPVAASNPAAPAVAMPPWAAPQTAAAMTADIPSRPPRRAPCRCRGPIPRPPPPGRPRSAADGGPSRRCTGDMDDFSATVLCRPLPTMATLPVITKKKKSLEHDGGDRLGGVGGHRSRFPGLLLGTEQFVWSGLPRLARCAIGPGQQVIHIKKVVPAP